MLRKMTVIVSFIIIFSGQIHAKELSSKKFYPPKIMYCNPRWISNYEIVYLKGFHYVV
jgi:hypothetical protein